MCSRKHATNVNDFVLGGRAVGPWLTAFDYGTSYFSAVVFVGYAGQFGYKHGLSATWISIGNAVIGSFKFMASPINAGAIAMVAGMIVVPVVSLITPKMDKKKVEECFECLEETVVVRKKTLIEE